MRISAATKTRLVLAAFVLIAVAPFAVAAGGSSFWQHRHSMAPVVTAAYLLVLAALVVGRYRWAWLLLGLFYAAAAVTWPFEAHPLGTRQLLAFAASISVVALLFSPRIRQRLRRPLPPR